MKKYLPLVLIIIISLLVRFIGIDHTLPYVINMDELILVNAAKSIAINKDIYAYWRTYAPLHNYIQAFIILVYSEASGIAIQDISRYNIFLILRLFVSLSGVCTVFVTYKIGEKVFNKKVGLISALFLGSSFVHNTYCQMIKNDVPFTFFSTLSLLFCIKIVNHNSKINNYIYSGIFLGLTLATSYAGILFWPAIILAHLLSINKFTISIIKENRFKLKNLLIGAFTAIVVFLIFHPAIILRFEHFLHGFNIFVNFQKDLVHQRIYASKYPGWIWYIKYLYSYGMYYPFFLLTIVAIIYYLKNIKKIILINKKIYLLIITVIIYCAIIFSNNYNHSDRITIPMMPLFSVLAASILIFLINKIKNTIKTKIIVHSANTAIIIMFIILFYRNFWHSYIGTKNFAMQKFENWSEKNIKEKSKVLMAVEPVGFSPNKMESRMKMFYRNPQFFSLTTSQLSVIFDYIILFHPHILQQPEWVSSIRKNSILVKKITSDEVTVLPLFNANVLSDEVGTIAGTFRAVHVPYMDELEVYKLENMIHQKNYVLIRNLIYSNNSIDGTIVLVNKYEKSRPLETIYDDEVFQGPNRFEFYKFLKNKNEEIKFRISNLDDSSSILYNNLQRKHLMQSIMQQLKEKLNLKNKLRVTYIGQDGKDYCSIASTHEESGIEDIHIRIFNVKKQIDWIMVYNINRKYRRSWPGFGFISAIKYFYKNDTLDVFYEPERDLKDDLYRINIRYSDGTHHITFVKSDGK